MANFTQNIYLDVSAKTAFKYINAKQLDSGSRFIRVTLLAEGRKIIPEEGATATIRAKKPDGTAVFNPAVINEDGTVTAELTDQMLAVQGDVRADIVIVGANAEVLSTVVFYIRVDEAPAGNEIVSQNELLEFIETRTEIAANAEAVAELKDDVVELKDDVSDILDDVREIAGEVTASLLSARSAKSSAESAASSAGTSASNAQSYASTAQTAASLAQATASEFSNLGISVSKSGTVTTVVLTKKDGTTETAQILDGIKGDTGESGASGAKGDKGDKGDKGEKGDTGEKGDKGDKGDDGATGPQGEKGDKGDKGDPGDDGYTPIKGTDYFTTSEINGIISDISSAVSSDISTRYIKPTDGIPESDLSSSVQTALDSALNSEKKGKITVNSVEYTPVRKSLTIRNNGTDTTYYILDITA